MQSTLALATLALASAVCGLAAAGLAQEPPPAFRGVVDLVTIDVQIAAPEGKPMPGLTADQFDVSIAGLQRTIAFAEFLHNDEGPVTRNSKLPQDTGTLAACMWGFDRSSTAIHAHFLLGVEPSPSDRTGVTKLKVTVNDRRVTVRRVGYRTPIRSAGPGAR